MRLQEYVMKHFSDINIQNEDALYKSFFDDFKSMLEWRRQKSGSLNIKGFEKQIFALRSKWNDVDKYRREEMQSALPLGLPSYLWGKMYAKYIVPMREEMFPDDMEKRREKKLNENIMETFEPVSDDDIFDVVNRSRSFHEYS